MSKFKNMFVKRKIFLLLVASDEINVFKIAEQPLVEHFDNSEHGTDTVSVNIVYHKYCYILVVIYTPFEKSQNSRGRRGLLEMSLVPRRRVTN